MKFFPAFQLGWLNGGLLLVLLVLTEGILFLVFQKQVVKRLFDRSGWTRRQRILTLIGKILALATVMIIILTPLKLDSPAFVIGCVLVGLGLVGLIKALIDFRNTPADQPATRGIYRFTRHPQNLASSTIILGCTIAIGSWFGMIIFFVARILLHANLVAEEEVCLKIYGDSYREYMRQAPRYLIFNG
jgi:protein-S-isoprenylcysteine O-methyltransferase Ste14